MTFNLDPAVLTRTGRASVDQAATLRGAMAAVGFGNTDVDDSAARERLLGRIRWLSNRLRANGTNLQAFAQEAADLDNEVGLSFLLLHARAWR
jgi:hypothetical protein